MEAIAPQEGRLIRIVTGQSRCDCHGFHGHQNHQSHQSHLGFRAADGVTRWHLNQLRISAILTKLANEEKLHTWESCELKNLKDCMQQMQSILALLLLTVKKTAPSHHSGLDVSNQGPCTLRTEEESIFLGLHVGYSTSQGY